MPRQRINDEEIRKIQSTKGSYVISLPIGEVRKLGWREGQKVVVKRRGKGFMIEDWKKCSELSSLLYEARTYFEKNPQDF